MNNIKDYLSEKTYELLDGYSGKPIAHFRIQTSRIPEGVFNENRHKMYFSQSNQTWVYIDRKVTREECIELYGPITEEEYGPRGGWKSVTFGTTKFIHDYMRP
jgi:hypothetical protein